MEKSRILDARCAFIYDRHRVLVKLREYFMSTSKNPHYLQAEKKCPKIGVFRMCRAPRAIPKWQL